MRTLTSARAHDALDAALDRLVQGLPAVAPGGFEPLLQTARAARKAFYAVVPEGVSRAQVAALSGVVQVDPAPEPRRTRHRVALLLIAAAVAAVLLGGAAVTASASALPGQLLYPVKRAVEAIDLVIHRDPASQTRLHLEFAQRRLTELSALLAARHAGQKVDVGAAMRAYNDEVGDAQTALAADRSDPRYQTLLTSVDAALQRHLVVLGTLKDELPGPAQVAIENALSRATSARAGVANSRGRPATNPKPAKTPSKPPHVTPSKSQKHGH